MWFLRNNSGNTTIRVSINTLQNTEVSENSCIRNRISEITCSCYTNSARFLKNISRNRCSRFLFFLRNYITQFKDSVIQRSSVFSSFKEGLIRSRSDRQLIVNNSLINCVLTRIDRTTYKPVVVISIILNRVTKITRQFVGNSGVDSQSTTFVICDSQEVTRSTQNSFVFCSSQFNLVGVQSFILRIIGDCIVNGITIKAIRQRTIIRNDTNTFTSKQLVILFQSKHTTCDAICSTNKSNSVFLQCSRSFSTIRVQHSDWCGEGSDTSKRYLQKIRFCAELILTKGSSRTNAETFNDSTRWNIRISKSIQEDLSSCSNTNRRCRQANIQCNPLNRLVVLGLSFGWNDVSDITFVVSCESFVLETFCSKSFCTKVRVRVGD